MYDSRYGLFGYTILDGYQSRMSDFTVKTHSHGYTLTLGKLLLFMFRAMFDILLSCITQCITPCISETPPFGILGSKQGNKQKKALYVMVSLMPTVGYYSVPMVREEARSQYRDGEPQDRCLFSFSLQGYGKAEDTREDDCGLGGNPCHESSYLVTIHLAAIKSPKSVDIIQLLPASRGFCVAAAPRLAARA